MFEERNLLGFRSLFNFPLHIIPSVFAKPDEIRSSDYMYWKFMNISQNLHVDYWLVLCAFSILIIGLWGNYRGKLLARFSLRGFVFLVGIAPCYFSSLPPTANC